MAKKLVERRKKNLSFFFSLSLVSFIPSLAETRFIIKIDRLCQVKYARVSQLASW